MEKEKQDPHQPIVIPGQKGYEDYRDFKMLEVDELFFPRDEKGELLPKKIHIEVGNRKEIKKVKKIRKLKELDNEGKLVEIDKEVEEDEEILIPIKKGILITPLPRGEWINLIQKSSEGQTTKDQDTKIIEEHLIEPKTTAEELKKAGRNMLISKIVGKILEYSSLVQEPKDSKKKLGKNQQVN